MPVDFITYLKTVPPQIDRELTQFLKRWENTSIDFSPLLDPLYSHFSDACSDGKRLRAALVRLGFEMTGGGSGDTVMSAALAYEVFQAAILAHDDIIDNSPLRRGKPTLFKALETRCTTQMRPGTDARHYGISQTICLGDMGLYLAIQLINDSAFDPAVKSKAIGFFTQTVIDTIAGELIDVELPYLDSTHPVTEDDLLAVCRYKTARYTIVGPLSLGTILAEGSLYTLDAIKIFGDHLGIAFQIRDDLLGIFGDEKTIGKSVTSDIEEGKITLPYWYALQNTTQAQKDYLNKHYGTGPIDAATHNAIKDIFITTGAKARTEEMMHKLMHEALSAIDRVTPDPGYRSLLAELAHYMITREK